MLLACFAEKKLDEILDKWVRQTRASFLRNRRARLGSYFCRTQSSEGVKHVQLLFLWDGRVASDTLYVFVSWQLHNITSLLTKVWIIAFLPLWFLKSGPSPAFCAIVFIKKLSLFAPTGALFKPRFAGARFYIVYCQVKRCIVGFHFRRSLFCVHFVGLYWTFLVVRHSKHFRCNGSYIPRTVSWISFFFSIFHSIRSTPALWEFDKVLRLSNTFLCAPQLQPRSPKGIVLLNPTAFKSASAVELRKRSISYRTWISSLLKAAEALGLLPCLCFLDPFAFRVCSTLTTFIRQSP